MDIINLARRSIFLMSNSLLKLITQIAVIILYAKQLSILDYGIYQSIWMYVNIISVIALFGLPSLILSNNFSNITACIKLNKKIFTAYALAVCMLPFVYFFYFENNMNHIVKILLMVLIFNQIIATLVETQAIKKEKEVLLFTTNILYNLLYLAIHLYVLYTNYHVENLLVGIIVLLLTKTLIQKLVLNKSILKTTILNNTIISSQWLFLGITDVVGIIFKWVDKWVVLLFISLNEFSIYFNGSYEIPIYGLMVSAIGNVMVTEMSKNEDKSKAVKVFRNAMQILSTLVLPSFCFMLFYYEAVFHFIFNFKYEAALPIFFITLFIIPVRITSFTSILQVYNKANTILKGAIIDLILAICLMALLYPLYKLKGIAIACVVSTYFQAYYYLWHSSKIVQQPIKSLIPFLDLCKTLIISLLTMGIFYYISNSLLEKTSLLIGIIGCVFLISLLSFFKYKISKRQIQHSIL